AARPRARGTGQAGRARGAWRDRRRDWARTVAPLGVHALYRGRRPGLAGARGRCFGAGRPERREWRALCPLPTTDPHMNFHEYQAKQLFADYGIAVPAGRVAHTAEEAVDAAKAIGGDFWVVKAQIHAGGRGKAGGVKLAKTLEQVKEYASAML